jgi:hypothetical protein
MKITYLVNDLIHVYGLANLPLPEPRAIALRLLEEAVELALACGASSADVHMSVQDALSNEHMKQPNMNRNVGQVADQSEITGELADVGLLWSFVQRLAAVYDNELVDAAGVKVERLRKAQRDGTLGWTADGRFYRNKWPVSTVEGAPTHPSRPTEVNPMGQNKGKFQGQDVTIVRPARQGDQGFDAAKGEQVIVKVSDGKEQTVAKSEVQSGESA